MRDWSSATDGTGRPAKRDQGLKFYSPDWGPRLGFPLLGPFWLGSADSAFERPSRMNVQQTLHELTRRLQRAHDDIQGGPAPSPFPDSPPPSRAEVHAAVADVRRALEAFVPVWSAGDDEARVKAGGAMREWSVAHSSCPYL
jgi:hypothetical protein